MIDHVKLSASDLAFFEEPRTWREIFASSPRRSRKWWRTAVMHADSLGAGWLEFEPRRHVDRSQRGAWRLSDLGRAIVQVPAA